MLRIPLLHIRKKVPYQAFEMFLQLANGYPTGSIKDQKGKIVGFGMLSMHNPISVFSNTAEITYFIDAEHTRRGLGRSLLEFLEIEGLGKGINTILAYISSLNMDSIKFHRRNGFVECGRFKNVGKRKSIFFDTVWLQKML